MAALTVAAPARTCSDRSKGDGAVTRGDNDGNLGNGRRRRWQPQQRPATAVATWATVGDGGNG
jgi:hypothetical protein